MRALDAQLATGAAPAKTCLVGAWPPLMSSLIGFLQSAQPHHERIGGSMEIELPTEK